MIVGGGSGHGEGTHAAQEDDGESLVEVSVFSGVVPTWRDISSEGGLLTFALTMMPDLWFYRGGNWKIG